MNGAISYACAANGRHEHRTHETARQCDAARIAELETTLAAWKPVVHAALRCTLSRGWEDVATWGEPEEAALGIAGQSLSAQYYPRGA